MLIGYVSDERYAALPDVLLEFEARRRFHGSLRRDRIGALDLPPGTTR